ncbi:MAG TPA: sodium:solute symporter [Bryobacteraceae bacterium]|nr:sodium:solute symporter [Bryobacteraceae bacterium]
MRPLDWLVLGATLTAIVTYGLYKGRGSDTVNKYLLAGKTMPWYAMALSIMATQASAITFISTTGQAYVDGMRFVQFYFGMPIAMVIISATAVPLFHRSNVYTAYEYLEKRFDAKTRALASIVFLIQRGISVGVSLYAPAIVLAVILGWPDRLTTLAMGVLITIYTTAGGIKAVTWTDVQQMLIIFFGLFVALFMIIHLLPARVSFSDAVNLAGAIGKLNAVDLHFDLNNRYNVWSGLIGGAFLALAYFGCDQSQVQRYLTGKSIAQSRLSLMFTAVAKIPMQFFILFIGAMVFVFYTFERPPLLFQPVAMEQLRSMKAGGYSAIEERFERAFERRKLAATALAEAHGDPARRAEYVAQYRAAQKEINAARADGAGLVEHATGERGFNDTNYIFLAFVTRYLPAGVVGLLIAVIFAAAMSSSSGEVNSLATVTVVDIYRRHMRQDATDRHYLWASRIFTAFWAAYAVFFAHFASKLGSLIEAVNLLGSLFYGSLLGVFVLAFFFRRVTGTGAFAGMVAGEAAIFAAYWFTGISFLWYNVIGCVVVIGTGVVVSWIWPARSAAG